MSNVSNPSNPINPTNPERSREPAKPGTKQFQELMKTDKSDEKQKKHKKRSEEDAKLPAGPASPNKNAEAARRAQKFPKIQKIGESEKKQPKQQKRPEELSETEQEEEAIPVASAQKKPYEPIEISKVDENLSKAATAAAQAQKNLDQIIEEEQQTVQKEEIAEDFKQATAHAEKRKKEEPAVPTPPFAPASSSLGPAFLPPSAETAPAYALLNSEAFALFEKMVSVITVLHDSGISETTIHLNTHEFANSPFLGAQIIIREYSTAPLIYNIELIGNPFAADLFKKNIPLLRTAFEEGKYRFRVNRLESSLSKEEFPKVQRKKETEQE